MNQPAPSTSRLPATLRPGLDAYGRQVRDLAGPRLVSLTVFGAVLTPDWHAGRPIHHALVLTADDLQLIGELSALGPGAAELGLAAPLVATPRLLETTRDSFPLEWLEIASCHEVLVGSDLFHGLVFAPEHVRLQCERECAVLAIALRQRLIRAHRRQAVALADLAEHALRVLRGWLHLLGAELPAAPSALIAAAAPALGMDLQPLVRALGGERGMEVATGLHRILTELASRGDHG
jgi:hypothetical protein